MRIQPIPTFHESRMDFAAIDRHRRTDDLQRSRHLLHHLSRRKVSPMQDDRQMPKSNLVQTMFDYIEGCFLLGNKKDALSNRSQARNEVRYGLALAGPRRAVNNSTLPSENRSDGTLLA
jgi:hypothetical protein